MDTTQFVKMNKITSNHRTTWRNKNMPNWHDAKHYIVTLEYDKKTMTLPYSQGLGIKEPPETDDVLDCLASDASIVDNCLTIQDFASEMGYDLDESDIERAWKAIQRERRRLMEFLGEELYNILLWDVERL